MKMKILSRNLIPFCSSFISYVMEYRHFTHLIQWVGCVDDVAPYYQVQDGGRCLRPDLGQESCYNWRIKGNIGLSPHLLSHPRFWTRRNIWRNQTPAPNCDVQMVLFFYTRIITTLSIYKNLLSLFLQQLAPYPLTMIATSI